MTWSLFAGTAMLAFGAAVAAVLLVRRRVFMVTVEGQSMAPTLLAGDRLLVRRGRITAMRTGQLVVLDISETTGPRNLRQDAGRLRSAGGRYMIKRLVALPGDPAPGPLARGTIQPGDTIPADHVVVLGDNTASSYDSRQVGYLAAAQVIGVMVCRLGRAPSGR